MKALTTSLLIILLLCVPVWAGEQVDDKLKLGDSDIGTIYLRDPNNMLLVEKLNDEQFVITYAALVIINKNERKKLLEDLIKMGFPKDIAKTYIITMNYKILTKNNKPIAQSTTKITFYDSEIGEIYSLNPENIKLAPVSEVAWGHNKVIEYCQKHNLFPE